MIDKQKVLIYLTEQIIKAERNAVYAERNNMTASASHYGGAAIALKEVRLQISLMEDAAPVTDLSTKQ
jgi:hypothetical protein